MRVANICKIPKIKYYRYLQCSLSWRRLFVNGYFCVSSCGLVKNDARNLWQYRAGRLKGLLFVCKFPRKKYILPGFRISLIGKRNTGIAPQRYGFDVNKYGRQSQGDHIDMNGMAKNTRKTERLQIYKEK